MPPSRRTRPEWRLRVPEPLSRPRGGALARIRRPIRAADREIQAENMHLAAGMAWAQRRAWTGGFRVRGVRIRCRKGRPRLGSGRFRRSNADTLVKSVCPVML